MVAIYHDIWNTMLIGFLSALSGFILNLTSYHLFSSILMIVTELTGRLGGRNDAMTAEHSTYISSRSGKLKSMKSGKLRSLQRILSPLNVVLDTLRQMSSLQLRSREAQSSFSDRRLKLPPSGDPGDRRLKLPSVSPDRRLILLPSPPFCLGRNVHSCI